MMLFDFTLSDLHRLRRANSDEQTTPTTVAVVSEQQKTSTTTSVVAGRRRRGAEIGLFDELNRTQPGPDCGVGRDCTVKMKDHPLRLTKRGKLQQRRSALNEQIKKQLRLRAGAQNLYNATEDKKIRELVQLELSFLESSLQHLKMELADLNTAWQVYQNDQCANAMPLITLGLKEAKLTDFTIPFQNMLHDYYHQDAALFDNAIKKLNTLRENTMLPSRDEEGVKLLSTYYCQLCHVERRFFYQSVHKDIYFEWFDAFTGVPSVQRSIAFEKGSVLFNIAALYTQIAVNQNRSKVHGCQAAVNNFTDAYNALTHLRSKFANSPSVDMQSEMLEAVLQVIHVHHLLLKWRCNADKSISLFQAQIYECHCEQMFLENEPSNSNNNNNHLPTTHMLLAKECAHVAACYARCQTRMSSSAVAPFLPSTWNTLVGVKRSFYTALAHLQTACATLSITDANRNDAKKHFTHLFDIAKFKDCAFTYGVELNQPPATSKAQHLLAQIHLRVTLTTLDECTVKVRLSKQLRKHAALQHILQQAVQDAQAKLQQCETDDKFADLYEAAPIVPISTLKLNNQNLTWQLAQSDEDDLFKLMGPVSTFCTENQFQSIRTLNLVKDSEKSEFGFTVTGDTAPVRVDKVDSRGISGKAGMKSGDVLLKVNGVPVEWECCTNVQQLINATGRTLSITLQPCTQRTAAAVCNTSLPTTNAKTYSPMTTTPSSKINRYDDILQETTNTPGLSNRGRMSSATTKQKNKFSRRSFLNLFNIKRHSKSSSAINTLPTHLR
ncbi:Rhophilin-2-A [Trichinella britovi]|uniref:Rhophilin-2-A n=2 Tax=Trichinella TaxID=6333 RepID=A0A0V1CEI8_TRIBR|nr:Rhophilin-2-A [Trichinella murrelli]KRY47671.1 Rhophilin-2-A [Trichinella britovi]